MRDLFRFIVRHSQNFKSLLLVFNCVCLFLAFSGCTINHVSILTLEPVQQATTAKNVKFISDISDINGSWHLSGMGVAYLLPIFKNKLDKRKQILQETAANAGADAIVALQPAIGKGIKRTGRSIGLFVDLDPSEQHLNQKPQKFIIGMMPVTFHGQFTVNAVNNQSKYDAYMLELSQYYLSYRKGYYIYKPNVKNISIENIISGDINANNLIEPLGIAPDYVLFCDLDAGIVRTDGLLKNTQNNKLTLTMKLVDLIEQKIIWENTITEDDKYNQIYTYTFDRNVNRIDVDDIRDEVDFFRDVFKKSISSFPTVKNFQPGAIPFFDK